MMCCSCPPCLEAATHLVCAVCGGVVASSSYGCLTFLFISSQEVASYQSNIEMYEEVSVECSSGVVRVWPCLTWWYLVFVCS